MSDIIDWTVPGNTPDELIRRFSEPERGEKGIITINTDIDTSVRGMDMSMPDPSLFNLVSISQNGAVHAEPNALIRYLKACRIVYDGTVPYMYNGEIYTKVEDSDVSRLIHNAVDAYPSPPFLKESTVKDIISKLRVTNTCHDIPLPDDWYDKGGERYDSLLVPFQNGLYSVDYDELLPFTPHIFIDHQLACTYRPGIQEHPVEKVYRKIIPDKDTLRFFFEMVGFTLFSDRMSPPSIFLIYGPGNTGKSALQEAVATAAGRQNVSTLDLSQLSGRFTTMELKGKLFNVCGETGSGANREISKVDGELLKRLSDGQEVMVEKKHKDAFTMRNKAKLWFVSNTLPDFGDTSSGLYRRLYIIPCRKEQRWEDQIYSKMQEPDAISWLINRAVYGYLDFLRNGCRFHVSQEMLVEQRNYRKQDASMDFLEDTYGTADKVVVRDRLDGKLIADVYNEYKEYVINGGGKPLSMRKFSEKIRNEYDMESERIRMRQDETDRPTYKIKLRKSVLE